MADYNDLPSRSRTARDAFSIPDWFTFFTVTEQWVNIDVSHHLSADFPYVVIEKRYAHKGGHCYRIDEYCVYGWRVTRWTGTVLHRLHVDRMKVQQAIQNAERLLLWHTQNALGGYADPTFSTAGGLIDLTIAFKYLPLPQVFGGVGDAISLGQLMSDITDIVNRIEPLIRELTRLRDLDGKIVARYDNVTWDKEWWRVKLYSDVEIVEVACADWILALEEGQTIRVRDHDEHLDPLLPPSDPELERELEEIRRLDSAGHSQILEDGTAQQLPPKIRKAIKAIRPLFPTPKSKHPIPEEPGKG